MKQRVITTIALWGLLALILGAFGTTGALLLLLVIVSLAQLETRRMGLTAGGRNERPGTRLPELALGWSLVYSAYASGEAEFILIIGALLGLVALVPPARCPEAQQELRSVCARTLYLPWMLQFYLLALLSFESLWVPVWMIAVAKFNDAGALVIGRLFGQSKMAPSLSPGKTWEGAVGGVLSGALAGVLIALVPAFREATGLGVATTFQLALALGPVAIASDLSGSFLKRRAQVKDSGNLIPGIGGFLDLVDSLLFVGPVGYGLLFWASQAG